MSEDKLVVIKRYMQAMPLSSKRDIMRRFAVTQYHLKDWETAGELKFKIPGKPKLGGFNNRGYL